MHEKGGVLEDVLRGSLGGVVNDVLEGALWWLLTIFLVGSVVFLPAPFLGVLVLAYPSGVVIREIWPRWLVKNEYLTWWCPELSVPGLTHYGRGLEARGCSWRRSRRHEAYIVGMTA